MHLLEHRNSQLTVKERLDIDLITVIQCLHCVTQSGKQIYNNLSHLACPFLMHLLEHRNSQLTVKERLDLGVIQCLHCVTQAGKQTRKVCIVLIPNMDKIKQREL